MYTTTAAAVLYV